MPKEMLDPRTAYGDTLVKLGKKHPELVVLDADLSKSTKTIMFAKQFPERFFEMGIAEANMISTAAGLASCGKIPFASTFAVFATGRVYDQIRMDVAYSRSNVKIFATHGGITVGKDGASHQMLEDLALMRVLPNMTVFAPSDAALTRRTVELMAEIKGPMYARIGRAVAPVIYKPDELNELKIGKGILLKEGDDATIIACGTMVDPALAAREMLQKEGISVRVVDMYTIKPLDKKLVVTCAKETSALITVEEHSVIGGLGGAVAETLAEEGVCTKFQRMGIHDIFCESGEPSDLLEKYKLNEKHIANTVRSLCRR